ncbi:unnamed protein product [Durusdinium trenchii]|uniref:Tyr recombinase domain-containing protein n=1 Tax=Durusdinium trenchii TaxID=1381693 RepID=A0ABP0SGE6_9DINO
MVDYEDVENLLSEDEDDRGFEDLPELIPLLPEDSFSFAEDVSRLHEFLPGDSLGFSGPFPQEPWLELGEPDAEAASGSGPDFDAGASNSGTNEIEVDKYDWNLTVTSFYEQYKHVDPSLKLPWENSSMQGLFVESSALSFPKIHGVAFETPEIAEQLDPIQSLGGEIGECIDAAYLHAVSDLRDLDYIEQKKLQTDLACSKWMDIIAIDWEASSVGTQVCQDLRSDPSGRDAEETLKASFGTKSHSTLLKRASVLKRYIVWHRSFYGTAVDGVNVFPLREPDVWDFFKFLKESRLAGGKGFTAPATFLETVRFCKFTIDLAGASEVLESKRLLGLAALEKREKGPLKQAPAMEVEHIHRLRAVLQSGASIYDRIGAGCMLICVYGRARWSDVRYIDHVEVESRRNGCLVLYTREHKTSSIGDRLDQFLPVVVPWDGITNDNWIETFLTLYAQAGLDIQKVPLGPLLPAPKIGGGFCARPLTTPEMSKWLRQLLKGTSNSDTFRAHSMKATVLGWCARAGLDKEVRAVLGHHCGAVTGSDVVYSRSLQVRPIRKLQMLLRLIRIGMGFEEIADQGQVASVTPAPRTPGPQVGVHGVQATTPVLPPRMQTTDPVDQALESCNMQEDAISAKEELENATGLIEAAEELTLLSSDLVGRGLIEIDSSTGSDSSSDTSSSSVDTPLHCAAGKKALYEEFVPPGLQYYKHSKSQRVHCALAEASQTKCKQKLNANYRDLGRVMNFKFPKCLHCFPKDADRIRTRADAVAALDSALERVREAKKKRG